jgi:hypothetical protein
MKLFARNVGEWEDEDAHSKAWAHGVLDLWMAGEEYDMQTINHALRITGDAVGLDVSATLRGHVLESACH